MSESLRDRVARVLYEVAAADFTEVPSFDDAHEFDKADHYVAADALIAAGFVGTEREVGMRGAYGAIIGGPERDFGTLWSVPLFERYVTPWREITS